MKKRIKLLLSLMMTVTWTMTTAIPTVAAEFGFNTGGSTLEDFGTSTSSDAPVTPDPLSTNIRRNKDAAVLPPPYGIFSGDIPTEPSSPYHNSLPDSGFIPTGQELPPVGNEDYAPGSSGVSMGFLPSASQNTAATLSAPQSAGLLPSTSQTAELNTAPWYYEDGTIGTLYVERTDKTVKVYEGEDLSNLKKGVGHFPSTSCWDGNVALAGHNRGGSAYFSFVKDMENGDTLEYTTKYGTRTYKVTSKTQINEWDNLPLAWSGENILTLITCVADVPENRYYVIASEVKE